MNFLQIIFVDQCNPVFIGCGVDEEFCLHEGFLQAEEIRKSSQAPRLHTVTSSRIEGL
jgi:hypothetical protein